MRNCAVACIVVLLSVIFILVCKHSTFIIVPQCPPGHFLVNGMATCHPWLTCSDLKSLDIKELIGLGAVKAVYRAAWKEIFITYSKLNNPDFVEDFKHGLRILKILAPSPYVVQLVGFCDTETVILTEYHKNGNAVNITNLLVLQDLKLRLKLCLNYALIVEYLHNSPAGTRIMCDSNDLPKLLSQFLVTDNFTLIINDLDALPEVNQKLNLTAKCGHRQLTGTFIAPEQLWPFSSPFEDGKMPGYDEKTDIWKAASVCDHFLGDVPGSDMARYHLFPLHKSCRHPYPEKRPTASQLVKEYTRIMADMDNDL